MSEDFGSAAVVVLRQDEQAPCHDSDLTPALLRHRDGRRETQARLLRYSDRIYLTNGNTLSIYRKFDAMRLPSNDVFAVFANPVPSSKPPERPVTPLQDAEHKRRRRAAPATVALPRTLRWVESLPAGVKPTALLRQYARIANEFAATWDDPRALSRYIDSLFGNDRETRKGFPPDVLRELLALREYHNALDADNLSAWTIHRKRG